MSNNYPIVTSRSQLASSRLFKIEQLDLQFSNGNTAKFECISGRGHGSVMIAAVNDNQQILLIREYAAAIGRYEIGLPKGGIDKGETALAAANREIQEELGYKANQLEFIRCFSVSPAYINHQTDLILATELVPQKLIGDEPEPLEVIAWDLNKLDALLQHPELSDARSIAALFLIKGKIYQ